VSAHRFDATANASDATRTPMRIGLRAEFTMSPMDPKSR
jgi:hypothetical protein